MQAYGKGNYNCRLKGNIIDVDQKGTLCYDPPVQLSNPKEYSCARMSMALIKRSSTGDREIPLTDSFIWNQPWNPLAKFEKTFSRSFDPGYWAIKLRLWVRGIQIDIDQRFSLVIEVIDENNGIDVWSEITNEVDSSYISSTRHVA